MTGDSRAPWERRPTLPYDPPQVPLLPDREEATALIQRITDESAITQEIPYSQLFPVHPSDAEETLPVTPPEAAASTTAADAAQGPPPIKEASVARASSMMAVATLASRLTGFLAKLLMMSALGYFLVSDSYNLANTLPNIVFELVIGGVLTSVAIPLLSRARSDPDGGEEYTQRLMTTAVVGLLVITALSVAAAPLFTTLYVSGGSHAEPELTTAMARLLLPQIFFYGIAALFGAILNTKERFAAPAWAPLVNNLVVIGVAIALGSTITADQISSIGNVSGVAAIRPEQLLLLGLGTTAGIVAQAAVMLPALFRSGFRFRWRWGNDPRLKEAGVLVLWSVLYALVSAVGFIVTTRVFTDKLAGGLSVYTMASLLFQLPYGILGVSVLTAIMPRMSRHAAAGDMAAVKQDASLANRLSTITLMPVTAAMLALAPVLAVLATNYGNVADASTSMVGVTLAGMAIGLVPLAVTLVQMRVFYAMKDARTPTAINAIMVAARIPLILLAGTLDPEWIAAGIAGATTVSYLVGAIVGEIWLRARYGSMLTGRLLGTVAKVTLASAVAGGAAWAVLRLWGPVTFDIGDAVIRLIVGAGIGLVVLLVMLLLLRLPELAPVQRKLAAMFGFRAPQVAPSSPANSPDSTKEDRPVTNRPADDDLDPDLHPDLDPDLELPRHVAPSVGDVDQPTQAVSRPAGDAVDQPTVSVMSQLEGLEGAPESAGDPAIAAVAADAAADAAAAEQANAAAPEDSGAAADATVQIPPPVNPAEATVQIQPPAAGADATLPVTGAGTRSAADRPTPIELAPGASIGGRYRLVSQVAVDGSGNRFWRARDTVLPRDMAVTLLPDSSGTSATVARTLRAGRLQHIGLPQTLDLGTDHGQTYVVGQWVDGATLTDLMAKGPLEPRVATSIAGKIAEAVAEAHRNGLALGSINPSLIRINVDGQVRFSHVIAHATSTPDADIRAVGALLYLMLTGVWPAGDAAPLLPGTSLKIGPSNNGRERAANLVEPAVPAPVAALTSRALHTDDPDGIHAVAALATLLRAPDPVPAQEAAAAAHSVEVPPPTMSPADRQLRKERRIKLGIASTFLAAFVALALILVGTVLRNVMKDINDSNTSGFDTAASVSARTTAAATTAPEISPSNPATGASTSPSAEPSTSASTSAAPAAEPVPIVAAAVWDPEGSGKKDYENLLDLIYDDDPQSDWSTWVYKQQFKPRAEGGFKAGVGVVLELEKPVTIDSVEITATTPGISVEIRSADRLDLPNDLAATQVLGSGEVAEGPASITVTGAQPSKFITVFLTKIPPSANQFRGKIGQIIVKGH